ncbi:MAG: SGNH/GDSL hydrolase family protein [Desulfarculaceae bacterium]
MKLISNILFLMLLAFLVPLALSPSIKQQTLASASQGKWNRVWSQGGTAPQIRAEKDLMPTQLPGPADAWAGSKPHSFELLFDLDPGSYRLYMQFFESHQAAPPRLAFSLNGKLIKEVQLSRGTGKPSPYHRVNHGLSISLPIKIETKSNRLTITNLAGSWAAPAKLKITSGMTINPAKAGYLLLSSNKNLLIAVLLILLAVFFRTAAAQGSKKAAGSVLVLMVSTGLVLLLGEFLFREYLIRFPQARHLAVRQAQENKILKGRQFSFPEIIAPDPRPDILYRLRPNLDGRFGDYPLRTNSFCMRGPAIGIKKPPGVLRIAGLGDSVLFGWGVPVEDTTMHQLQEKLGQEYAVKSQALNFSCPSYNTAVEVAIYRHEARRFKPDVAVLVFVDNDFSMPSMLWEPVRRMNLEKSYIREQLRRRLAVYWDDATFEREKVFMSIRHSGPLTAEEKKERKAWGERLEGHFKSITGKDAVAAGLHEFSRLLAEDKALGIVLYYQNHLRPLSEDVKYVSRTCRELGLAFVDMTPVFRSYVAASGHSRMKDTLWVSKDDSHPNRKGHELMAQAIIDVMLRKGVLKHFVAKPRENLIDTLEKQKK